MAAVPSSNRDDSDGFHRISEEAISVGPWGGKGGDSWDDGVYAGIRQIILVHGNEILVHGSVIHSISIEYERNWAFVWLKHGGSGGDNIEKIELDYPKERITSISGRHDVYLRSLTFETNLNKIYGPYGVQNGTYFSLPMAEGKLVGFHGRSGLYLDCIGVYVSKIPKAISVGPWGGESGDLWDDGVYAGIRQIKLVYGSVINSINIGYESNGAIVWSKHGGNRGNNNAEMELDYPKERITSISGRFDTCLRSLTFETTFESNVKKTYGPFGVEDGTYFSLPMAEGKIVGFHGQSGLYGRREDSRLPWSKWFVFKLHWGIYFKGFPIRGIEDGNENNDTVGSI